MFYFPRAPFFTEKTTHGADNSEHANRRHETIQLQREFKYART